MQLPFRLFTLLTFIIRRKSCERNYHDYIADILLKTCQKSSTSYIILVAINSKALGFLELLELSLVFGCRIQ